MIQEITYDSFGNILKRGARISVYPWVLRVDSTIWTQASCALAGATTTRTQDDGLPQTPLARWVATRYLYGYCLDDPVRAIDRTGLFQFGVRPIKGLSLLQNFGLNSLISLMISPAKYLMNRKALEKADDKSNTQFLHEAGKFQDGSNEIIELFPDPNKEREEDPNDYTFSGRVYDDKRMRRAYNSLPSDQTYNLIGIGGKKNNWQDYADTLRDRYGLLDRGDRQR